MKTTAGPKAFLGLEDPLPRWLPLTAPDPMDLLVGFLQHLVTWQLACPRAGDARSRHQSHHLAPEQVMQGTSHSISYDLAWEVTEHRGIFCSIPLVTRYSVWEETTYRHGHQEAASLGAVMEAGRPR